ncbi:MAG: DMT family transporter [Pseudomonadota bacterium]
MTLFLLTALTMVAFAANSVLARLALAEGAMDATSFSAIRLAAGAIVLTVVATNYALTNVTGDPFEHRTRRVLKQGGNWFSAIALLTYIVGFSFAYLALGTGTGALILFATVQGVMIGWGLVRGNRPGPREWLGLTVAFGAFVALLLPGLTAPDPLGAALMVLAGIGWGIYSLRGAGADNPLMDTAGNFVRGTIMVFVFALVMLWTTGPTFTVTGPGLFYALLSGALTSGLGYALWYRCLRQLTASRAAIVQLSVPAIATLGGVVFLSEPLTVRLAVCSALILGGVALAIVSRPAKAE